MPVTRSTAIKMEEMLKQLLEMMQDLKNSQEDMKTELITELRNSRETFRNSLKTMKNSQEIMKSELKTEVEKKVQVIEEKVHVIEETATSPKNEVKKDVKRIESEAENIHEELKMGNEGTDGAKANGTTDSIVDTTTDNAERKPESNGSAKKGESSGSVAAGSFDDTPENEEGTTDLQVAWEVLELAKKIHQKRGEEGEKNLAETFVILGEISLENENFESASNDVKESLRMQNEIAAPTVKGQQDQDQTKKLQRSREESCTPVTRLNDGVWRIPKSPRAKMKFVHLNSLTLFQGSAEGVT